MRISTGYLLGLSILLTLPLIQCQAPQQIAVTVPDEVEFSDQARNIVLMIGDGMGLSQITAALYMNENSLNMTKCRTVGFMHVESADNLITDSAAGATAMATGKKTNNNMLSMTPEGVPIKTIFQEGKEKGKATGVLVTSSIVHATPAAFITNQPFRWFYEEIALSYLEEGVDLLIGGGRRHFEDRERDNRDLVKEFTEKGYLVQDINSRSLGRIEPVKGQKLIYFTHENQPDRAYEGRNYLSDATDFSLNFLKDHSENGFLLMIEGSQIDMAAHHWKAGEVISEVQDFDKAVGRVLDFVLQDKHTLLIITADHETAGMSILRGSKMGKLKVNFATNAHTPQIVPVFAIGPGEEFFNGFYDNTELFVKMRKALGWDKETP